jgi:hypothetical protein
MEVGIGAHPLITKTETAIITPIALVRVLMNKVLPAIISFIVFGLANI